MKIQKLLMLISFCWISIQLNAQSSIGLKAGYVKAWEEYGDVGLPDDAPIHIRGLQISALAYTHLHRNLEIGIEPGFVQRGAACEPGFVIFRQDTKLMLNYAELPLILKGKIKLLNSKIEVFGKLGYGVSMILKATREVRDLSGVFPPVKTDLDIKNNENMERWDHGVYSSLGVAYNLGKHQIFFESSFYHGLRDVDKWNTSMNRSLQFNVGYMISLSSNN